MIDRASIYKRPESVLVVVYTRTGKVLLLKRTDHPDFWQSITGAMHWDENEPCTTAARELQEETGLIALPQALRDLHLVQRFPIFPQWRHRYAPAASENTEHAFALELADEAAIMISPREHSAYGWFSFEAGQQRAASWTNRVAIQEVQDNLKRAMPSAAASDRREMVVLVHGLWTKGWSMSMLAQRLRRAGFETRCFSYPTIGADLRANVARLHAVLATLAHPTIHLVGHSLGNVVVRGLFHLHPQQRPGRVVMLAPPNQGSVAAAALARSRFGRSILGKSVADMIAGVPRAWAAPAREVGVISGSVAVGLGRLITELATPNDGVLTVAETALTGAPATLTLPVAHTSMLVSRPVASAVIGFLRNGRFA